MDNKAKENELNEINRDGKKKRLIVIIIAAIVLIALAVGIFIYTNAITAVTMRIQRLVGTVNLYNEEGSEQSLREKMRLGAGQTVTTAGESLIMVSLDDTKLMTMEETSKADIKARGKKLLFDLIEGNLFFNVTEKLKDNESFDISTSTMVCGIRGTSSYVGRDSTSHEILMVTDGLVHVVATNPVTKETTEVDVPAGQMITIYLDEEAEGDKTISIRMEPFREEDLPAMALDTMRKNRELMNRVAKATGFSSKKLATLADLSCTKGISMYGTAADDFKSEGVDDAIPFMGSRAGEMVTSANSAVNIAKEDLPLEVAIIQGYRDVMDVGVAAGYDKTNMATLMDGTRTVMEETFTLIDEAGIRSVDKLNVAVKVSETLKVSAGRMTESDLSTEEISQVLEAEKELFTDAVKLSVGETSDGSRGSDVLAALDKVVDHVTGTVDEEMEKSSNGEETVIALLGVPLERRSSASSSDESGEKVVATNNNIVVIDARENGGANGNGASSGNAGSQNSTGGRNSATSKGGATASEIKAAQSAIASTDPSTGIITLADGTRFDPKYYAAANPDVVAKYGNDPEALIAEWLKEGKAQGRPPIAPEQTATQTTQTSSGNGSSDSSGSSSSGSSGGDTTPTPTPEPTTTATPTPTPTSTATPTPTPTATATPTGTPTPTPSPTPVPVTGVSLDITSKTDLKQGKTFTLTATVSPSNAANKNVTWKSTGSSTASVQGNGLTATVTGAAAGGPVDIIVQTEDGSFTASCEVTVIPLTSAYIDGSTTGSNTFSYFVRNNAPANAEFKKSASTGPASALAVGTSAGEPVTIWVDGSNVYWYSDADTVYLPSDCQHLFGGNVNYRSIDMTGLDISNVTDMREMFSGCSSLVSVNISGFSTSHITNMSQLFSGCTNLTSVTFGTGWDTSSVINMDQMFNNCQNLVSLDLSGWDLSNVTSMGSMFAYCTSCTELTFGSFRNGTTYAGSMFNGCTNLNKIYVTTNYTTSPLYDYSSVRTFENCPKLSGPYTANSDYDASYAIVDTSTTPGLFTLKQ